MHGKLLSNQTDNGTFLGIAVRFFSDNKSVNFRSIRHFLGQGL
jgi:hypothetical protein